MGALKWGLKATLCNLCTIVCNCALSWPFVKGKIRRKMTTILGNRGQLWTSTLSPHLQSTHLDFPDKTSKIVKNCQNIFSICFDNFARHQLSGPFSEALIMGFFEVAVFHHGWRPRKQPIKQLAETPTSTSALMGLFRSVMGLFLTLMGCLPNSSSGAVFPLESPLENSPVRKGPLRGS